eukprot:TRINITY_DN43788_c0_g1_i1.p1 TRINITY_DN43788_c0_g1~~TRINITY_DN43788_c0_g1_i1.p1  ORF type:complete len:109 (-),score=32.25 TRINITY_DN43788_c0_g1_i1:40-366(-)
MLRSLVGSEMCIRDRTGVGPLAKLGTDRDVRVGHAVNPTWAHHPCECIHKHDVFGFEYIEFHPLLGSCLLYTSDAADEEDSVDLGGRRIIKKKKKKDEDEWRSKKYKI